MTVTIIDNIISSIVGHCRTQSDGILPTCLVSDCQHDYNLKVGNMITSIYNQIAVLDKFIYNSLVVVDTFILSFISVLRLTL